MTAEAYYNMKEFSLAREEYRKYIQEYPQSDVAINAQYAIAWTYLESNDIKIFYSRIPKDYRFISRQ